MAAPVAAPAFRACERAPAPGLLPYVTAYTGYRQEASAPSVHQGVASGHLTFLLCLDGRVEMLANADPRHPPGSFTAAVGGLHDVLARIAQAGTRRTITPWSSTRACLIRLTRRRRP